MPDATLNYTAQGIPFLDADNYVDVLDEYTSALANRIGAGTGWRSITPINGWSAGALLIRRVGVMVELHLEISAVGATSGAVVQLPAGFGLLSGAREVRGVFSGADPNTLMRRYYINPSNQVQVLGYATTDTLYGQILGITDDAWPASLPGTPA